MTSDHDIGGAVARLDRLFEDRLRLKRGDFDARAKRARGMLPRRLRRDLSALLEARKVAGHPKLARMLDGASLHAASSRLEVTLDCWSFPVRESPRPPEAMRNNRPAETCPCLAC